jgi:hypothetical protein
MFRKKDLMSRQMPTRYLVAPAMAAILVSAAFGTTTALAHGDFATPAGIVVPAGYAPYSNGMGDPLGVTLTRHADDARMLVADAKHGGIGATNPLAEKVRAANARFADVAVAKAEGYSPIPCVSGIEGGAMGIHFVNGALIEDKAIDLGKPEAVMYEPKADGSMELVAVEYITTEGPATLEGHLFSFSGSPNRYGLPPFYELHVWAWRDNPTGTFADMNPKVSCDAAVAAAN